MRGRWASHIPRGAACLFSSCPSRRVHSPPAPGPNGTWSWQDGSRIGHIIDPRNGRPVNRSGSVTVWHESAFVADVLSTALYVMGPDEGIAWAATRGIAACFIVADPDSGDVAFRATHGFEVRFPLPLSSETFP